MGTDISVLGVPLTITHREKSQEPEFKGIISELQSTGYEDVLSWQEGVGGRGNPLDNLAGLYPTGLFDEILISCSVGDEVIYGVTSIGSEVKKQWLDFTHTTKPRPKSPGINEPPFPTLPVGARDETDGEEMLTGEYSAKELFVNLKTLSGPYVVTLTDDNGKEVYRKEVQTSNIVALNTDLTKYVDGTYTLIIENSEEQYTATLALPLIDDTVPTSEIVNDNSVNRKYFDLSGRQLSTLPTQKGVYIREGRKVLVK